MTEHVLALAAEAAHAVLYVAAMFSAIVLLRHGVAWLMGIPPYED